MDPAFDSVPQNPQSDAVVACSAIAEKRPIENGDNGADVSLPSAKKPRIQSVDEMKRVAEIVLVLSGIGKMRAGKNPTDAEIELMTEARAKLAEMCQQFAPTDIVGRDAVAAVIEDLGLNEKLKDQRLGFRQPKLTISEKLSLAKRKIEESKKFNAPTTAFVSHPLQPSHGGVGVERPFSTPLGPASHTIRMLAPDKPSPAQVSSTQLHFSAASNTPVVHQLSGAEVKQPTVSTPMTSNHFLRNSTALPRVERPFMKLEGASNGPANVSIFPAVPSSNIPTGNAATWSIQSSSMSFARLTSENKMPNHHPIKVDGSSDANPSRIPQPARDQSSVPFLTQTATGKASTVLSNHNEIAKIVQKLLQPQIPIRPTWTPPSREYMNKPLPCQICKGIINDVESVVVCDACEKGFHTKCIQPNYFKGIPKVEWHCAKCVQVWIGKPFPPKYGRVMKSVNASKSPSDTGEVQSVEKKPGVQDLKVSSHTLTVNGSPGLNCLSGFSTHRCLAEQVSEQVSESKTLDTKEMLENNSYLRNADVDQKTYSATCPNNSKESVEVLSASSVPSFNERSKQPAQTSKSSSNKVQSVPESENQKTTPPSSSPDVVSKDCHSQLPQSDPDIRAGLPDCEGAVNNQRGTEDSERKSVLYDGDTSSVDKEDQQDLLDENSFVGSAHEVVDGGDEKSTHGESDTARWIGKEPQILDGKRSYSSCCVNGVTYKVQDHALLCFGDDKLIPSKLQSMWEDCQTGSKWVLVNKYHLPSDLPEAVGLPSTPESDEVYESIDGSTISVDLLQGSCKVLPALKFKEEYERRRQLGHEAMKGSSPIFLCKWTFDELKQNFQPISS